MPDSTILEMQEDAWQPLSTDEDRTRKLLGAIRTNLGLGAAEFAELIGQPLAMLNHLEAGRCAWSRQLVRRLPAILRKFNEQRLGRHLFLVQGLDGSVESDRAFAAWAASPDADGSIFSPDWNGQLPPKVSETTTTTQS